MRKLPKWNRVRLYSDHTKEQLIVLEKSMRDDPSNWAPRDERGHPTTDEGLYKRAAVKKFDEIAHAIQMHVADGRKARGETINTYGYSGRKSKRR